MIVILNNDDDHTILAFFYYCRSSSIFGCTSIISNFYTICNLSVRVFIDFHPGIFIAKSRIGSNALR